jgi:hypothetical protein
VLVLTAGSRLGLWVVIKPRPASFRTPHLHPSSPPTFAGRKLLATAVATANAKAANGGTAVANSQAAATGRGTAIANSDATAVRGWGGSTDEHACA